LRLHGVLMVLVVLLGGCSDGTDFLPGFFSRKVRVEKLTPETLAGWKLVGKGEVSVDETTNALILTESADSKGITLVSPRSYGRNVVLSFDVVPVSYEGVNFVFLSASDKVTQGELKVPDDYAGNMEYWTEGRVQNYFFAFHNGFFDSKPYIKKNPGLVDIAVAKDVVPTKDVYHVEIGRKGRKLWIKIDDEVVVKGKDKSRGGLPGGKIGFRLRGSGTGGYTCLFRNVEIREEL